MRKKIMFILLFLIGMFVGSDDIYAANYCDPNNLDRALIYDVENLEVKSDEEGNYYELTGWAFIHNCHQCGDAKCYGENDYNGYNGRYDESAYKNNGSVLAYYNNTDYFYKVSGPIARSKIVISYVNTKNNKRYSSSCGGIDGCEEVIKLSYNKVNLFSWMCNNSEDNFHACTGYVVDNVGFTAKIRFPADLEEGTYKLLIAVKLIGDNKEVISDEVSLGVSKNVYKNGSFISDGGANVTISNLSNNVKNINNKCVGIKAKIVDNTFKFDTGLCWAYGQSYTINAEYLKITSGEYKFSTKHYRPVTMYKLDNVNNYWAPATWVTTNVNGSPIIKIENPDKVCSVEPNSITNNSCSDKSYKYECDGMKITTDVNNKEVSGIVKVSENGEFKTKKGYSNLESAPTIIAGKGFSFNLHYDYYVEWSFSNYSCNGVNESICYSTLKTVFEKVYLNDVSADNLKSRLDNSGKAVTSSSSFDSGENINDAGEWSCSGTNKDSKRVISCKYEIKPAYYEYATNKISYTYNTMDRNKFKDLGSYFYIPLDYSKNSFKWNITTGTISLVKYRTVMGKNNTTSANWSVGTTNSCKINVRDGALTSIPPTGDDGKLVYRSVSTNVNMDNASLYYLTTNTNWYNYFYKGNAFQSGNASRIVNSYTHLHYKTVSLNSSRINSLLSKYNNNYLDWNYISNGGKSSMINNSDYFTSSGIYTNSNKHCSWGEFSSSCDKYS